MPELTTTAEQRRELAEKLARVRPAVEPYGNELGTYGTMRRLYTLEDEEIKEACATLLADLAALEEENRRLKGMVKRLQAAGNNLHDAYIDVEASLIEEAAGTDQYELIVEAHRIWMDEADAAFAALQQVREKEGQEGQP